jgi:benzoate membrane transport protein
MPPSAAPPSFVRDFSGTYLASAIVAFIFAASGPVAIILAVGAKGGLREPEIASWIFGAFFLNGFITVGYSLVYRQPLAFFWTIPGTVLVAPAMLAGASYPEVVGAYLAAGALMAILGAFGLVGRAMAAVPMPIVMGMVAGVFLQFGLAWVKAFETEALLAGTMTAAYLAFAASPAVSRRYPPLLVALAVGLVLAAALGRFAPELGKTALVAAPIVHVPAFRASVLIELVVPLVITVLVVQNGQGVAALTAAGHTPPVDSVAVACGLGSIVVGLVGTVSTCLTGPTNALLVSSGVRERQYTAAVLVGVFAIGFGLFSPVFTRVMLAAPPAFIATLAGLAMLNVLRAAFATAFQGSFGIGALVTFLVTVAGIPIFNIGAPFWGLVIGSAVSRILERADYVKQP